jgi:hypothetical protein
MRREKSKGNIESDHAGSSQNTKLPPNDQAPIPEFDILSFAKNWWTRSLIFLKKINRAEAIASIGLIGSILSIYFTWEQGRFAAEQVEIARTVLNDSRTAEAPQLDPRDIHMSQFDSSGSKITMLATVWINSGRTATVNLQRSRGCGYSPREAWGAQVRVSGTTPLAPGQTQLSGACVLSSREFVSLIGSNKPYFISSTATYSDRLQNTKTSKVCYGIFFRHNGPIKDGKANVQMQNLDCSVFHCDSSGCKVSDHDRTSDIAESKAKGLI